MKHNIRGYPTINAYMGTTSAEETYYGDRTVDAFFSWIEHEHKVIDAVVENRKLDDLGGGHSAKDPNTGQANPSEAHVHLRVKGDQGKLLGVEGCAIKGCASIYAETFRIAFSAALLLADALLGACLALLAAQMWRPNESPVTSTCSLRMSPSTSRTRSLMRRTRLITYRSAHHSQRLHGSGSSRTATPQLASTLRVSPRSTVVGRCFHAKRIRRRRYMESKLERKSGVTHPYARNCPATSACYRPVACCPCECRNLTAVVLIVQARSVFRF